jgi:hypothetical protein
MQIVYGMPFHNHTPPKSIVIRPEISFAGKWHVGIKAAFELFPGPLKKRLETERKKRFDEQHRAAITAATAAASKSTNSLPVPLQNRLLQFAVNVSCDLDTHDSAPGEALYPQLNTNGWFSFEYMH